jgi:tryptophan synthase alpha chain
MSRIDAIFAGLRARGETGLVTYVTAGDPDLARSADILRTLDDAGADILEVGVPFSDPLADGPVIQRASERALAAGTSLAKTLDLIGVIRSSVGAAIVVFTYANPLLRMGLETFMSRAAGVGVDGLLVLDLPIEEASGLREAAVSAGIDPIFLLSPTTTDERIRRAGALGRGFLYGISRLGVTGERDRIADGAKALVGRIRASTQLPVALGFGISRPEHVRQVGQWADAAVVGSGLVSVIARAATSPALLDEVGGYVRWLKTGQA